MECIIPVRTTWPGGPVLFIWKNIMKIRELFTGTINKRIRTIVFLIFMLISVFIPLNNVDSADEIVSMDVYYLLKSIDDSLVEMHSLYTEFDKVQFADNIKISSNFQRALLLAEEFSYLHTNIFGQASISEKQLQKLEKEVNLTNVQPEDVYRVLSIIKNVLLAKGNFIEYKGNKIEKTPSDVYQMMRQISHHHLEIFYLRDPVPWKKPERVYEANLFSIYSQLIKIVKEHGLVPEMFSFPKKPTKGIKPKDVYAAQIYFYDLLQKYLASKVSNYEPVYIEQTRDQSKIDPGDVFELSQIIIADIKSVLGNTQKLGRQTLSRYYSWKSDKLHIIPGDVYNLVQHNISLLESLNLK